MGGTGGNAMVVIIVFLAGTWACSEGRSENDPGAGTDTTDLDPGVVGDLAPDGDATTPACFQCIRKGMMLRWNRISLVEPSYPEGLPEFLNNILQPDVDGYRINLALRIDDVRRKPDGNLAIRLTTGATWHDLDPSEVLEIHGGDKTPAWYGFIDGYATEVNAVVEKDCGFGTTDPITVMFKSGPPEFGFMCSPARPEIEIPRDVLPFEDAYTWGYFTDDCSRILNARIDSCIRASRACEICVFILSPDYTTFTSNEDPSIDSAEPCTSNFCKRWCGTGDGGIPLWSNLGAFIDGIGVERTCEVNGDPGYRFKVEFEAELVNEKP